MLLKLEGAFQDAAGFAGGGFDVRSGIELLTVAFDQLGFVIKRVHLAGAAVEKNLHDAFDLRAMMQAAVEVSVRLRGGGEQAVTPQQMRHGDAAKAAAVAPEELTACHRILARNIHQFTNMNSLLLKRTRHALARPCCFAYAISSFDSSRSGAR